jgi:hypothetical protein
VLRSGNQIADYLPDYPEDVAPGDLWYRRRCLAVCQLTQGVAEQGYGLHAPVVLGMFQNPTDPQPLRHAWLEAPDGTIVDPTSKQMGLEECAVIQPGEQRYGWYHSRGSWQEGDDD